MKPYRPDEAYRVSSESARGECPRWATVAIVIRVLYERRPVRGPSPSGQTAGEWRYLIRAYVDELRILIKLPRRRNRK